MLTLESREIDAIHDAINGVWDLGYSDKGITFIESIAALTSIETVLMLAEDRTKNEKDLSIQI